MNEYLTDRKTVLSGFDMPWIELQYSDMQDNSRQNQGEMTAAKAAIPFGLAMSPSMT